MPNDGAPTSLSKVCFVFSFSFVSVSVSFCFVVLLLFLFLFLFRLFLCLFALFFVLFCFALFLFFNEYRFFRIVRVFWNCFFFPQENVYKLTKAKPMKIKKLSVNVSIQDLYATYRWKSGKILTFKFASHRYISLYRPYASKDDCAISWKKII